MSRARSEARQKEQRKVRRWAVAAVAEMPDYRIDAAHGTPAPRPYVGERERSDADELELRGEEREP